VAVTGFGTPAGFEAPSPVAVMALVVAPAAPVVPAVDSEPVAAEPAIVAESKQALEALAPSPAALVPMEPGPVVKPAVGGKSAATARPHATPRHAVLPSDGAAVGAPVAVVPSHVGPPVGVSGDVMAAYARQVWARIEQVRPKRALEAGVVSVTFAVGPDGGPGPVTVVGGSGVLDRLAVRAVQGAAPFPPPPAGATPEQLIFAIQFRFD